METKERNEGIDLLRIVAMFFVMMLFTIQQGGLFGSFAGNVVNLRTVWALDIISVVAVNVFAIISGYVGFTDTPKPFRVSKYFMRWLMVFTFSIILIIVQALTVNGGVSGSEVAASFFPVTRNYYWYFTAYTGLFLLMPLLNTVVRNYSQVKLKRILLVMLIAFSAYDFWSDKFIPSYTLTMTWLAVMYLVGAIIKKCNIGENLKSRTLILIILLCYFFSWVWKLNIPQFDFLGITITGDTVIKYSAPAMVIAAMAYVILFSRIRFKKGGDARKFISFCAPAVFAAYIIACHPYVWSHILAGGFAYLCQRNTFEMIGTVMVFAALLLGVGIILERGRMALFDLMRVEKGLERLEDKIRGIIFK